MIDILSVHAENPGPAPVLFGNFLYDDMQAIRLRVRVFDHGVGDGFDQTAFLIDAAARPYLYGHDWHLLQLLHY